jgi:hypothetical protein
MKTGPHTNRPCAESGVANLIEYIVVSAVLMVLLVVIMLQVNTTFMQTPADTLSYVAFTDIANGVSTRIVDIYALAPSDGMISSKFDIPGDVAGKNYFVVIRQGENPVDQDVEISQGSLVVDVSLAGIGASRGVTGNTTGAGMNIITYDSGGYSL